MTEPELEQLRGQRFSVWARKVKVVQGRKGRDKNYLRSVTLDRELIPSTKFPEDALTGVHTPPMGAKCGKPGRERAEVMVAFVILILCVMGTKYSPSTAGRCSDNTKQLVLPFPLCGRTASALDLSHPR